MHPHSPTFFGDHMTIANTCVLAAAVLPVLTMGLAKFTSIKKPSAGGYDNNDPRGWAASTANTNKGRASKPLL
jgi:uncharacterized MAPEG superfamily protein